MSQTHKHLGTSAPAAATNATAYTAPAGTKAIISAVFCCNTAATDTTLRFFRVASGGAAAVGNALYYDLPIRANDTFLINGVPVLEAGDFLVCRSANGAVTFTVSGLEIT